MATNQDTADYIVDQLQSVGNVHARKMFGEYALYCDEKVVGLICENNLFIKITDDGKKFVGKNYREGYAYKGAKVSMQIDEELIEKHEWLCKLITLTADNLPRIKKIKN